MSVTSPAPRDENFVPVLMGVDPTTRETLVPIGVDPATNRVLTSDENGGGSTTNYSKRVDEDSGTPGIYYFGKADIGAAEADPVWQIKRIDTTTISAETTWAEVTGNPVDTFVHEWTDRESLTYS